MITDQKSKAWKQGDWYCANMHFNSREKAVCVECGLSVNDDTPTLCTLSGFSHSS
jgi:hypothetical protein